MDAVSEVKAKLNIEDVISEYVNLKRTGANYKGLSPFTSEKTPSFVVSPDKQIWHDFSSGRGGDMFTFIQEVEGVDFKTSLDLLARKAGVDLSKFDRPGSKSNPRTKERLYEILDASAKFYQVQLTANQKALDYVIKKRKFNKKTLLDFRLGYSPSSGDALGNYLKKKGFTTSEIKNAGLSSPRGSDMFRGRIMIPLCDQFGKVVGFTARLLESNDEAPKYINTPSTVLYDKSRHVYGLHLAKKAIQSQKFSVLVEGNLDVISSHQHGVSNVVATAGTALTEMQIKTLGRFSSDVRLAFDEDRAGLSATERAIPIAGKCGVNLSIITIPDGKDPDELIQKDPKLWQSAIKKHKYAVDWLIDIYEKDLDLTSAVGKKDFASKVLPVIEKLSTEIEKDHYIKKISQLMDSDPSSVRAFIKPEATKRLKSVKPVAVNDKYTLERKKITDQLLSLTLHLPKSRVVLKDIKEEMLPDENSLAVYKFIKNNPEFVGGEKDADELHAVKDYVKILSLHFEELYSGADPVDLYYETARLRTRLIELFVKDQKQQIISALETSSDAQTRELLKQVRGLDKLLKNVKE